MTSRHQPPIRLLTRLVVPTVLAAATLAILAYTSWQTLAPTPQAAVTPVAVVEALQPRASAEAGILAPGWIEPAPHPTEVRALREGVVTDILALEGESVEAGAVLVRLEHGAELIALRRQEAALRLAEAEVAAKEAAARAAERTLELALDAEHALRAADAALREAEAARAKAAAEAAEAESLEAESRDEHERKQKLVESGTASAGDLRRHAMRLAALASRSESLRQEVVGREARVAAARGDLESARLARHELIDETRARDEARAAAAAAIAARDGARAAHDEARLALERSEVRAPVSGTVMRRNAVPGTRVGGDADPVLVLYDPSRLQVRCDVPFKDAAGIVAGLGAEVRVDALPDRVFRGKLVRIVPQGDIQKNTLVCKVLIEAPDAALRPDMLARVRIATRPDDARVEAVAVPEDSLRSRDGAHATVVVAIPDGTAARAATRSITLGDGRANGWIEVLDGLAAGDRVVLDPVLAEGTRFVPVEKPREAAP